MIKELDTVVLAKDLKEHHLKRGDMRLYIFMMAAKPSKWNLSLAKVKRLLLRLFQRVMFVPCGERICCMSARMRQRSAFRFSDKELGDFGNLRVLVYNQPDV
jgi:hypothetical protein